MVHIQRTIVWTLVAASLSVCTQTADAQIFARRRTGFGGFGYTGNFVTRPVVVNPTYSTSSFYSGAVVLPGWSASGYGYAAPRMRSTLAPAVNVNEIAEDTNVRPAAYQPAVRRPRRQYQPAPYIAPRYCFP